MNVRTGEIAADAAWPAEQQGPEPPVAMMLVYNGSARPSRAVIEAWNRPTLMGFESSTTRSYAGGDAGEADAAYSCGRFDEVGYPRECGSWCCAADTPVTAPALLANVRDYARRYALRMIAGGRSGPITWYGNPAAVEAACAGTRDAGLVGLRWGVGTWGYGEGGSANQPPAQADAELVQSGNTPGPLAVPSDLNWLYVAAALFVAWFGPAGVPAPEEEDDMQTIGLRSTNDPTNRNAFTAAIVDGGVITHRYSGPFVPSGFLLLPDDAARDIDAKVGKPYVFTEDEWLAFEARTAASATSVEELVARIAAAVSTGGGGGVSGPTAEQVAAVHDAAGGMKDAAAILTAKADKLLEVVA